MTTPTIVLICIGGPLFGGLVIISIFQKDKPCWKCEPIAPPEKEEGE